MKSNRFGLFAGCLRVKAWAAALACGIAIIAGWEHAARSADKSAAPADRDVGVTRLSGGRLLEFVGVCDSSSDEPRIWSPDGRPRELPRGVEWSKVRSTAVAIAPHDRFAARLGPDLSYTFLFRCRGIKPDDIDVSNTGVDNGSEGGVSTNGSPFELNGDTFVPWRSRFRKRGPVMDIRVSVVGQGDWSLLGISSDRAIERPAGVLDVSRLVRFRYRDRHPHDKALATACWSLPLPCPELEPVDYLRIHVVSTNGTVYQREGFSGSRSSEGFDRLDSFQDVSAKNIDRIELMIRPCSIVLYKNVAIREAPKKSRPAKFTAEVTEIRNDESLRSRIQRADDAAEVTIRVFPAGTGMEPRNSPIDVKDEATCSDLVKLLSRPNARQTPDSLRFGVWSFDKEAPPCAYEKVPPEEFQMRASAIGPGMTLLWAAAGAASPTSPGMRPMVLAWIGDGDEFERLQFGIVRAAQADYENYEDPPDAESVAEEIKWMKKVYKIAGPGAAAFERDEQEILAAMRRVAAAVEKNDKESFSKLAGRSTTQDIDTMFQLLRNDFRDRRATRRIKIALPRGNLAVAVTTFDNWPAAKDKPAAGGKSIVYGLRREGRQWLLESIETKDFEGTLMSLCRLFSGEQVKN